MEIERVAVRREDWRHPERVSLACDDLVDHGHPIQVEPGDPSIRGAERHERSAIGEHPERQPAGRIPTPNNQAVARQRVSDGLLLDPKRGAVEGELCDGAANEVDVLRLSTNDDWDAIGG